MASVKRTFTLPEEFSRKFDELVPKQERSEAVLVALKDYLKQRNRAEALEYIRNLRPMPGKPGMDSVEMIRHDRQQRSLPLSERD